MATLGYRFPKENKDQLLSEIAQSVKNYKADVLRTAIKKQVQVTRNEIIFPKANLSEPVLLAPVNTPQGKLPVKVQSGLIQELMNSAKFKALIAKQDELSASSPEASSVNSVASSPLASSPEASPPAGTNISKAMSDQFELFQNQLNATTGNEELKDKVIKSTNEYLKTLVQEGVIIYGARGRNQKKLLPSNILKINKIGSDDRLAFQDGTLLKADTLSATLRINSLNPSMNVSITGNGIVPSVKNRIANFGKFHLSLPGLKKLNLTVYRPKSNIAYLSKKNISPRLVRIIHDMRLNKTFDLDEYNQLSNAEQIIADRMINLGKLDYPVKMKRTLDETVWNLKQRYEILLGSYNAGNDGKLVVNELKQVLGDLLKYKAISKAKHDYIVKALE
jgi:hypothetical protein